MQKFKCIIGVNIFILLCLISSLQLINAKISDKALFTQRLYNAVTDGLNVRKTFVIAPNTVRDIMTMLYLGATGQTRNQLHEALELTGNQRKVSIRYDVPRNINTKKIQLSTTNVFFVNENFALSNRFLDLTKEFKLKRQYVDFHNTKIATKRINEWIRNNTQRRIPDMLNQKYLDKASSGVIVSLIQFNAVWKYKFNSVKEKRFYTGRKEFRKLPMMQQKNTFRYNKIPELNAEVIELPFNKQMSMMIILPDLVENGIPDLEKALSEADLFEISSQLNYTELWVEIPHFKYTSTVRLKKPLRKLDVKQAFTHSADFSPMFAPKTDDTPTFFSNVIQRAQINIEMKSVQASVAAASYSSLQQSHQKFLVNRPFVYFIKDNTFIYMAGRYNVI